MCRIADLNAVRSPLPLLLYPSCGAEFLQILQVVSIARGLRLIVRQMRLLATFSYVTHELLSKSSSSLPVAVQPYQVFHAVLVDTWDTDRRVVSVGFEKSRIER